MVNLVLSILFCFKYVFELKWHKIALESYTCDYSFCSIFFKDFSYEAVINNEKNTPSKSSMPGGEASGDKAFAEASGTAHN